jgi:predicted PurR-regulated permease PerM
MNLGLLYRSEIASIIIAALILTIFEIIFFFWLVAPTTSGQIKSALNYLSDEIKKAAPGITQMPPQIINSVVDEENELKTKYNRSLIADASWVGGLLIIAFLILGWWQSPIPLTGWNTLIFAGGSAVLFIGFQIYFYFLVAKQYNYPTSPELELAAIKGLNKAVKTKITQNNETK